MAQVLPMQRRHKSGRCNDNAIERRKRQPQQIDFPHIQPSEREAGQQFNQEWPQPDELGNFFRPSTEPTSQRDTIEPECQTGPRVTTRPGADNPWAVTEAVDG